MDQVCTIGLDVAKNVFQVHGVDQTGAVVTGYLALALTFKANPICENDLSTG